ncbi:MAG: putative membrane protein insertion efficiency factor [Chlamydiae bacterium]|nr:putative membrane protein insertion efficiency factor [Chlamydiota bacterium]
MKTILVSLILPLLTLSLYGQQYAESSSTPWGADVDLLQKSTPEAPEKKRSHGQKVCYSMIRFFQTTIGPIDGPRSSYYPTSSQYALEAIEKYGVFTGIALGCDRLMRENGEPWIYPTTHNYGIQRKLDPVR